MSKTQEIEIKNNTKDKMELVEKFNPERVDRLLKLNICDLGRLIYHNDDCKENNTGHLFRFKDRETYLKYTLKWLKKVKANNYELETTYKRSKYNPKGRQVVEDFGLQLCQHRLRGYLCEGSYTDYDMSSAHINLLLNMVKTWDCLKNGIDTTYLKTYSQNREEVLRDNSLEKRDILAVLNKDRIKGMDAKSPFLSGFHKSLKPIKDILYAKYSHQFKLTEQYNKKSRVLNALLLQEENRVLTKAVNGLRETGVNITALVFDGIYHRWEGPYYQIKRANGRRWYNLGGKALEDTRLFYLGN